ncbi:lactate 2-monooxygenase [Aeromicrobium sp. PE09-221]|uniref:alpha-hydroxy-acid oxidizing protein n=1 Tax=Aeromicrobium sp. PE09-221 TaxID=1898043 RepID=UPI000B3E80A4|nr:alpha-hydroxy-acid oxidizing protein [Aeromicrobium sp. PE09-221]OUZ10295.1 lactate 2-monooxygenase [Aeromicrobium sp. PE09-221]
MSNFSDFQLGVYLEGILGQAPTMPFTFSELEAQAQEAVVPDLWDYVAGGAGDEHTQQGNVAAFERLGIRPRMLVGAGQRDQSVDLFGMSLPSPVFMAPIGVLGVLSSDGHGDIAAAKAAAATGVPLVGSTLMQDPLEEVAANLGQTPGMFQLYTPNDRELAVSLISRAESAGYRALVVTLDTWTLGYRPRDLRHGTFPQLGGAGLANYTSDEVFLRRLPAERRDDPAAAVEQWAGVFGNPTLSWADLDWLRGSTSLPLILKGICAAEDVRQARDAGVDGIYCSNHGGRQAASAPALTFLPEVVAAAGDLPVLFDSGVRSGVDIVKALALGATAVGIGRPYGYGAALGATDGIVHVLKSLLAEMDLTMALNGYASITELHPDILLPVP